MRCFRVRSAVFAVIGLAVAGCAQTAPPASPQPTAAVPAVSAEQARADLAKARAEFVAAYNAADTDRFVALFADNASYSGLRQTTWVQGRDEIHQMWTIAFTKDKGRDFVFEEPLTTFADNNRVAVDIGSARMNMAVAAGTPVSRMKHNPMRISITWIQTDQGWKILSMAASPKAPVAPGFLQGHS